MIIVKMTSKTHPNFQFKTTSNDKEEAIKSAFRMLEQLGNFHQAYEVSEVFESED